MSDWVKRAAVPEDEGCLASMWLKAYAHCRDARRGHPGAEKAGSTEQLRYWRVYQPIVTALLRGADVTVLCDPERADYDGGNRAVIWAWSCTLDDRVFWVGVKRGAHEFAADMVRDLLGDALERACTVEFWQMDLHRLGLLPGRWRTGGAWLRSMLTLSEAAAARDDLTAAVGAFVLDPERSAWRPEEAA